MHLYRPRCSPDQRHATLQSLCPHYWDTFPVSIAGLDHSSSQRSEPCCACASVSSPAWSRFGPRIRLENGARRGRLSRQLPEGTTRVGASCLFIPAWASLPILQGWRCGGRNLRPTFFGFVLPSRSSQALHFKWPITAQGDELPDPNP